MTTKAANDRQYFTPPQIAKMTGASEDTVYGWIHSGELKAVNMSKIPDGERPRWRISRDDLDQFFEARANKPVQPIKPAKRRRKTVAAGKEWF